MKKVFELKNLAYAVVGFVLFLASCDENKIDFNSSDSQNVENEASTDGYFEDADDISSVAVWSDNATSTGKVESSGGRKITIADLRFSCATVTIEPGANNSSASPAGTITIDFGTGCTDTKGNVRKGKIIVTYNGKRYAPGATRTVTFSGYSINGVLIEGERTVTNIAGSTDEAPKFSIEVIGGKATWPDGTFATREVRKVREWVRASNPLEDKWVISQASDSDFAASGTNRNGKTYQMNITTPLVYKRECAISNRVFIAVEGTKELITESKRIVIDYGTGDCDRSVTITVNGQSKDVIVRGDI
jgi:hypothetical protein